MGGISSSIKVMVSSEGGGQGDDQLQGGDGGLQVQGDQAGGEAVPEIMLSEGRRRSMKTINISKLISDWDAIDHCPGDVTGRSWEEEEIRERGGEGTMSSNAC